MAHPGKLCLQVFVLLQDETTQRCWGCGAFSWCLRLKAELSKDRRFALSSCTGTALLRSGYLWQFMVCFEQNCQESSRTHFNIKPNINYWSLGWMELFPLTPRLWQETLSSMGHNHKDIFRGNISSFFFPSPFLFSLSPTPHLCHENPIWKKTKHPAELCQFSRNKTISPRKFSLVSFPSDILPSGLSKMQLPSPEPGSLGWEPQGFL